MRISWRGSGDHVLDKIKMTRSINNSAIVLCGLKLPQGNIDGDPTFSLSLEFVEHPCILKRPLVHFSSFLFRPLNHMLIETPSLYLR
ncbi:hypothetical protein AXF42_Ash019296 [Apostasia shenzhenica]|uniref:Uncharacterized protein n=1 Tax=Apostasia shenzhenica TaxID=1088818 RepID=A0A2I0AR98_9ASPA|nr:hypothetical protein AXF42_Ash019296 [Apostasia shenzhenica]